jgi:hypothetical protein
MLGSILAAAIARGLSRLARRTRPTTERVESLDGRLVATVDRRSTRYRIALEGAPIATGTGSLALALDHAADRFDGSDRAAAALARRLAGQERDRSWRRRLEHRHRTAA